MDSTDLSAVIVQITQERARLREHERAVEELKHRLAAAQNLLHFYVQSLAMKEMIALSMRNAKRAADGTRPADTKGYFLP